MAATISYSLKHSIRYCIPTTIENPHYPQQEVYYSPNIKYCDKEVKEMYGTVAAYYEPFYHFQEIPKIDCDILIIKGYFQSAKFINPYRKEILKILDIPYEFKEGWVSIHVRRTDYLKLQICHPVIPIDYILDAMLKFIWLGYEKFLMFSDDIEWCKENINSNTRFLRGSREFILDCNIEYSEGKTEVEDLSLASSCQHSIGSNSSFSWWIYFLNQNKNKIGVFPTKDRWFGESLKHNVDDLYLSEWYLV